ncbi:homocysteine S-methyltransferase family protein [Vibrio anguillarum]|uniref:Homocysteine S-methyltransferase family protein n=1 Tax=Vibrio anguillarum TaxID=55601 RepID=A0ABR9Z3D9_VIBAN|nr:homocysteine S-methyltransferase family protein [Vibrio anguillarum]MBF4244907.1 homocysteine S-methyltransferase family protein [Vibrio anguillarum]MBF4372974.1 homocysteine S-methyltransferase family protein [Vibrio anguillarum]
MSKLTLLDGGMGRELKRIGAPFSQPLWSAQALIESPQHVRLAHQGFIDSGADIITVNSYACVPFHLGESLYQTDGARLANLAAQIAAEVAQQSERPILVAGSMPPAMGSYRPDLFQAEVARAISLTLYQAQDPYVDVWLAETIASLEELSMIQSVFASSTKPCYYALTLKDDTNIAQLRSGQSVSEAAEQICSAGGAGIFFNCSIPEVMADAIQQAKTVLEGRAQKIEIGVYANSFTPIKSDHAANETVQAMREFSAEDYLAFAKQWYALGATVIGGCCGITPRHIQALYEWRRSFEKS